MDKVLYDVYTNVGFKALLCKGYHLNYFIEGDDKAKRSIAKQSVTRGFQKLDYKSKTYEECSNWVKQGGWLGWLIPANYIALDVDKDVNAILQVEQFIQKNKLVACIHNTKNGKHYFFKSDENIKTSSSVLIKLGLDQITYRVGGVNYLILEPTEPERKWENLADFDQCSFIPDKFLSLDVNNQEELLAALVSQVKFYHKLGDLDGFSIDMAFAGYLVRDLELTEQQVCSMFEQIFTDTYDEKRTILIYENAQNKKEIQKIGTFIDILNEIKLSHVVKLISLIGKIDTSHNKIIEVVKLFNKDFFIIDFSGKVRFCQYEKNKELKKYKLKIYNQESFDLLHATKTPIFMKNKATGKIVAKKQIDIWKQHPKRRFYSGITYSPGRPSTVEGEFNLWTSFAYTPIKGKCELYLAHVREVICANDDEKYNYVICWMADAVQNLMKRPGVALGLRGKQGTGKGFFVHHFGVLFGQHYLQINGDDALTTNFNSELRDTSILFADEVIFAGDHRIANKLKGLITEPSLRLELKGLEAFYICNYLRFIIASNNEWLANVEHSDRRYFVITVDNSKIKDYQYFKDIEDELLLGGYEALLYFLLNYKITIDLRDFPQTEALTSQKLLSMSILDEFFTSLLSSEDINAFCMSIDYNREIIGLSEKATWVEHIRIIDLYMLYSGWCRYNNKKYKDKEAVFGRKVSDIFDFRKSKPSYTIKGHRKQQNSYEIPSIDVCKERFSKHLGYSPFDEIQGKEEDIVIEDGTKDRF